MSEQWFTRLAEVPGVGYPGSPGVDRSKLPGVRERPTLLRLSPTETVLEWRDGSASPAHRHGFDEIPDLAPASALTRLAETLELPGTVLDYHYAMQRTVSTLWAARREDPEVLEHLEGLAWLDIRLVQTHPGEFLVGQTDGDRYLGITALNTLRGMYEREGLLRQALEVERVAAGFGQSRSLDELEAKVALLDGENQG